MFIFIWHILFPYHERHALPKNWRHFRPVWYPILCNSMEQLHVPDHLLGTTKNPLLFCVELVAIELQSGHSYVATETKITWALMRNPEFYLFIQYALMSYAHIIWQKCNLQKRNALPFMCIQYQNVFCNANLIAKNTTPYHWPLLRQLCKT